MKLLLRVLDKTGDTRHQFDLESTEDLAAAQAVVAKLQADGYSMFNVAPGTNDCSKRIESLSEASEEVIAVPRITSG